MSKKEETKIRVIALYLPQFHPVEENDKWWGKGFTEWTNVGKAKPLFKGHYQPRVPGELGYYDLRIPEIRKAQAQMAKNHGIEGFCYWHYWFGNGKRILERPFNEVLSSGEPDFPFCLAWANESWKSITHGVKDRAVLMEQSYPGVEDYIAHFYEVLPAFKDKRYIKVDGKPLFMIYKPLADPEIIIFINTWRRLATEQGLMGIYFIGHHNDHHFDVSQIMETGVDAVNTVGLYNYLELHRSIYQRIIGRLNRVLLGVPLTYTYEVMSKYFIIPEIDRLETVYPSLIPGWDHSPRSGGLGLVLTNCTPELFEKHTAEVFKIVMDKAPEHRIVFIKSWNEWAEGNYMEPDIRWGTQFLEALKRAIDAIK